VTFSEIASSLYPRWILGTLIIIATYFSSYKDLLKIDKSAIVKWSKLISMITIYRIIILIFFNNNESVQNITSGAAQIPWPAALTVFWEDAVHGMLLAIFARVVGDTGPYKKALVYFVIFLVSLSFGIGHIYQGAWAAIFLSLYVPFTFKKGQQIGFGTIMICHIVYDLATMLTIQYCLR
jgi:uncharacterized integral membrane protein